MIRKNLIRLSASRLWRAALVTALVIGLYPGLAAQVFVPGRIDRSIPAAEPVSRSSLSSRELSKKLDRAESLAKSESYSEALRVLQSIFDAEEDAFVHLEGDPTERDEGTKARALKLLAQLPAAARELREQQEGPAARRLLDDAVERRDIEAIRQISRRYPLTRGGNDAAYQFAADCLDHDRPLLAAVIYSRLLKTADDSSRFEPYLSLRCAASWLRAGQSDQALEVLQTWRGQYAKKTISIQGKSIEIYEDPSQALTWLAATVGVSQHTEARVQTDWMIAGGDPSRNSLSTGTGPYLNRGWRASTLEGTTGSSQNDQMLANLFGQFNPTPVDSADDEPSPAIPTFQPLVVGNLVLVRSLGDVRAYERETGRLIWASIEKDRTLLHAFKDEESNPPQAQIPEISKASILSASRVWSNVTYGTLSSDGELVFAVEESPGRRIPLPPNQIELGRDENRLVAYQVHSGIAVWELGGVHTSRGEDEVSDPFAGVVFLGPPLILDQRLYVLVESQGDIRVMVIEPRTGRLDWQQSLGTAMGNFPPSIQARRRLGLTPSHAGDVLVCPLGAEQVVAVNLSQRALSWRYRMKQPDEEFELPPGILRGRRFVNESISTMANHEQNGWVDSRAIISGLRVVLTPHDSDKLHCLNLLDGTPIWTKPRGEGLYVAGVHQGKVFVVGKNFVNALKLTDGEPAWMNPANIPPPSGRGFMTGESLYVPLMTAETVSINLHDGRVGSRIRSHEGRIPGNLVAVRGAVVSQTGDSLDSYRQLDSIESEITDLLARNPDDPKALGMRGEIRLNRGKAEEAYADLKRALELNSGDAQIRKLLVGSLLEALRVDYAAYQKLDAEILKLVESPEERASYFWLKAAGRERAGETGPALDALLEFADPRLADFEYERIDGELVARRDRLIRARAESLFTIATPEVRQAALDKLLAQAERLHSTRSTADLSRLSSKFGEIARGTQLERWSVDLPVDAEWLADEFRLEQLTHSTNLQLATTARQRLAQLFWTAERPRDVLTTARQLEGLPPAQTDIAGKTARDLAAEWLQRPELMREREAEAPWPAGKVEIERMDAIRQAATSNYKIPFVGPRGPYFEDAILRIEFNWREISARDSFGRTLWKVPVEFHAPQGRPQFNRAYAHGHFLLLSMCSELAAIDVLGTADAPGPRLLWTYSMRPTPQSRRSALAPRRSDVPHKQRQVFTENGEFAGMIGPITTDHVTLLVGQKLISLDPLTGKQLWAREGITAGTQLFGDDRRIFAASSDATVAKVYNAVDGSLLGERKLPPSTKRIETLEGQIITWRTKDGRQVLGRFDPWTGAETWSRDFEDTAELALIQYDEAAVLEISGRLTVVSLADGTVRFTSPTEPEPNIRRLHVMRSRDQYTVIANQPGDLQGWIEVSPQTIPVNGRVYGFDRKTGARLWSTEIMRQGIDLQQPVELPVVTFLSHYSSAKKNSQGLRTNYSITCLNKRNGKIIFDNREFDDQLLFAEYIVDAPLKQIDLRMFTSTLRLTFTDKPLEPEKN